MPYLPSSQEWLQQSALLLKAYPTSTRITSRYTVLRPGDPTSRKRKHARLSGENTGNGAETTQQHQASRAVLILKTFDPKSGVCLKYQTDKAAEVGRLVASLGKLGRNMSGLPEQVEEEPADTTMHDALAAEHVTETSTPVPDQSIQPPKPTLPDAKTSQGGAGGVKKKTKKGKK